jgi:hypothetical protein
MKTYSTLLMLATMVHATPQFVGVLTSPEGGALFAISVSPDRPPQWTKIGATIEGYSVVEYKSKDEVLILKRGELLFALPLKVAKIRDSGLGVAFAPAQRSGEALDELDAARKKLADSQARLSKLREEREKSLGERQAAQKRESASSDK